MKAENGWPTDRMKLVITPQSRTESGALRLVEILAKETPAP